MESAIQAFELYKPTIKLKTTIECMCIVENLLYYGDNKKAIRLLEYEVIENELKVNEKKTKAVSGKISYIENFTEGKLIALIDDKLALVDAKTLKVEEVNVKSSITNVKVGPNSMVAIARGKKIEVVVYREDKNLFASLRGKEEKKLAFPGDVTRMAWNGDLLGVAHKKAYIIYNSKDGSVIEFNQTKGTLYPSISVASDLWIVTRDNYITMHNKTGKELPDSKITLEASKNDPVLSIQPHKQFLLILYEQQIKVFNLTDPSKMQRIEIEGKINYKGSAIYNEHVLLGVELLKGSKKSVNYTFLLLHEIPIEVQMKHLLIQSKVNDAYNILLQNCQGMPAAQLTLRREVFNVDAAWALLANLNFTKAVTYFSKSNFDPRELLMLIPGVMEGEEMKKSPNQVTLESLIKEKGGAEESKMEEGINIIVELLEKKRKSLTEEHKDGKEILRFTWPTFPLNENWKGRSDTVDNILSMIDTGLLKLYVMYKKLDNLKRFFELKYDLKCNIKEMNEFVKGYLKSDEETYTAEICQIFLYIEADMVPESLAICKQLLQFNKPKLKNFIPNLLRTILVDKAKDKKLIQDYARNLIILNPEEGMKVFTENENLSNVMKEDDVLSFLTSVEKFQPDLKRQYLEHLVKCDNTEERLFTSLGLLYINKIKSSYKDLTKEVMKKGTTSDPLTLKYKGIFMDFLKKYKKYSAQALLEAMKDGNLLEETIYLHSVKGEHEKALDILVDLGKINCDFTLAENYCLQQPEPLFALLLKMILDLYTDYKNKYIIMLNNKSDTENSQNELSSLKNYMSSYEAYCKDYLKRYADNEKMNASQVINILPDEWSIKDVKDEKEDKGLLKYLMLTINDRVSKSINYKIAKNAAEMKRLDLQATKAELQKAFILMSPMSLCKVCDKPLGSKSFCVFPNGVVTHTQCSKDNTVCPIDNINFAKVVYE